MAELGTMLTVCTQIEQMLDQIKQMLSPHRSSRCIHHTARASRFTVYPCRVCACRARRMEDACRLPVPRQRYPTGENWLSDALSGVGSPELPRPVELGWLGFFRIGADLVDTPAYAPGSTPNPMVVFCVNTNANGNVNSVLDQEAVGTGSASNFELGQLNVNYGLNPSDLSFARLIMWDSELSSSMLCSSRPCKIVKRVLFEPVL
jgi:hypothetical protein